MSRSRRPSALPAPPEQDDDDHLLFRRAMSDAIPLRVAPHATNRINSAHVPVVSLPDRHGALTESRRAPANPKQSREIAEEATYLREGLRPDTLKKLRRGHWVVQDTLDVHGTTRDEAQAMLFEFLDGSRRRRLRCLCVIHGKGLGSPRKQPILRGSIRNWLRMRDDISGYCPAPEKMGGSGATLVLMAP